MAPADELPAASEAFRAETWRGAEGFFRVGQDRSGRWSLRTPDGHAFFACAVHGARPFTTGRDGRPVADAAIRLRSWGFTMLGASDDPSLRDDGFPFLANAGCSRGAREIVAGGVRLPDVFDPEWPRHVRTRAEAECAPARHQQQLVGWISDDQLEWGTPSLAGRPSLLQVCLSLEPAYAAYHAAWEFVLALHAGRIDAVARAWATALPNKEVVRELTRADEGLGTRGYLRDEARWTREFARRYMTTTSAAIRAHDPNHLVFGGRYRGSAGAAALAECVYPAVDVALVNWNELASSGSQAAQPVLASDVSWVTSEFLRAPTGSRSRLTTVERMLRRGRVGLDRILRSPSVVGYAWSQWQDEPAEQPPFAAGLIHVNGVEAREHVELLSAFNARAQRRSFASSLPDAAAAG